MWDAVWQVEQASQELEELREMKEDVERRERAQATVIENQAKRLDELETLYKARCALYYTPLSLSSAADMQYHSHAALSSILKLRIVKLKQAVDIDCHAMH